MSKKDKVKKKQEARDAKIEESIKNGTCIRGIFEIPDPHIK